MGVMTIQQMKYFIAVADSGSISEGAKRMFASQSGVSEAVRAVENHYGIKAFVRTSKGVALTGDGKDLLIEFKEILNRMYYLDVKYEEKKKQKQKIHSFYVASQHHICGIDSFASILKSPEYEDYQVGFQECKTTEVLDQVEKGMAEVGIIFFSEQTKGQMVQELRGRGIIFNHIGYKTAHVYVCENHPLSGCSQIIAEDIIQYPFITYDRAIDANPAYTQGILANYRVKKVISVSDRAAAYSLMRNNHGFAVGSGYHTKDENYGDIKAIPIQDGVSLEIGWIVKNNFLLSDLAKEFVERMRREET